MTHIRCVIGFGNLTDQELMGTTGAVLKGLPGNKAFSNPPPELAQLQTAADEMTGAMASQVHGGRAATAEKKKKRAALIAILRALARYVEANCGNDPATLLSKRLLRRSRQRRKLSAGETHEAHCEEWTLRSSRRDSAQGCSSPVFPGGDMRDRPQWSWCLATRGRVHQLPIHADHRPDSGSELCGSCARRRRLHRLQRLERPCCPHVHVVNLRRIAFTGIRVLF
jgi:hypothetical protein